MFSAQGKGVWGVKRIPNRLKRGDTQRKRLGEYRERLRNRFTRWGAGIAAWTKKHKKYIRAVGKGAGILFGIAVCLGVGIIIFAVGTAPKLDGLAVAPTEFLTTVLDDDGQVMTTLAGEGSNRVYVTLEQVPVHTQQAFVAIEDERFYRHMGIDIKGILRAAVRGVMAGRFSEGASTITQQLLKNNVFTGWTSERSFWNKLVRKLQEQALAIQLERQVSKEWILENYLNTINLGSGCWGVQAAAKKYFGKDVSGLDLAESAMLAGLTKNPSGYSPLNYPEAARQRQELVLEKMRELGYITDTEYGEALAEPVTEQIAEIQDGSREVQILSWYEDALLNQVCGDLQEEYGYTKEEAWRLLYRGGLTVEAAQDSALQAIAEEEINREENYSSDAQASLVLLDFRTGQVKAIVGGRGEKTASLVLNRATDSMRQPGSTLKVVGEYAAVLEKGGTLGDVYDDAPCMYADGSSIRNVSGTFGGRMTVRQAITDSVNVVAVKAFRQTGAEKVYSRLKDFGFAGLTDADLVESLALGGTHSGVTNLELTAAYGALANRGRYCEPAFYSRVLNRDGTVLLEREAEPAQVVDAQTADLLTSAMESVLENGTGQEAAFSGMSLAGKSGTTTDRRDVWFVGYSPYYACGVWGGYDDNRAQSGSNYVKRIWRQVMSRGHERLGDIGFIGVRQLSLRQICGKCGKLAIEGLCSHTLQGDMSYEEAFIPGTEPREYCDCHEQVQICTVSGKKAGIFCPLTGVQRQTYLRQGTPGTADETAVMPEGLPESSCTVHGRWWNGMFGWLR